MIVSTNNTNFTKKRWDISKILQKTLLELLEVQELESKSKKTFNVIYIDRNDEKKDVAFFFHVEDTSRLDIRCPSLTLSRNQEIISGSL